MLTDVEESTFNFDSSVITISDQVQFENVKTKYFCDMINPTFVTADYIVDEEIRHSICDWIGILPRGWNSLNSFIAFESIYDRSYLEERKWKASVSLKFFTEFLYCTEFQFVYISGTHQVLGTSSFFRFYKCVADAEKPLNLNRKFFKSDVSEAKITPAAQSSNTFALVAKEDDYQEKFVYNPFPVRACVNDAMLLENRNGVYMPNCKSCERLPDILKLQHKLFYKIKIMADSQRDLQNYIKTLEEKLQRFNTEQGAVQSTRSPPTNQPRRRPRFKKSSALLSHQLKLKAIIGMQDEKLRIMSSRMAQMVNNQNLPKKGPLFEELSNQENHHPEI